MVTPDGLIFHIDFGWVLGADPMGPLAFTTKMWLSNEFLEPLGFGRRREEFELLVRAPCYAIQQALTFAR